MKLKAIFLVLMVLSSSACEFGSQRRSQELVLAARQTMEASGLMQTIIPPTELPTATPMPTATRISGPAACVPQGASPQLGLVVGAVDGYTIEASIDGQIQPVRYIGLAQPPANADVSIMAMDQNLLAVLNQVVMLIPEGTERDEQGRLLRYVFIGDINGEFVNYNLIRQGYAVTHKGGYGCEKTFRQAEYMAALEGIGFWKFGIIPTPTP